MVDTGSDHSCGVQLAGTLWCWGFNGHGQLGDGTNVERLSPVQAGTSKQWTTVATGGANSCGIRRDNSLWCWGFNAHGAVGVGDTVDHRVPSRLPGPANWAYVDVGGGFACGIRLDQSLWCWGYNGDGELGDGTTTDRLKPVRSGARGDLWSTVGGGAASTCGIQADQSLYCWGSNEYGQLGLGDTRDRVSPTAVMTGTSWSSVGTGEDSDYSHTCGVSADHTLWCWGANQYGQLGTGDQTQHLSPYQIDSSPHWTTTSVGGIHSCAARDNGTLWCWGANPNGQLGIGSLLNELVPTQVGARRTWTTIRAGELTTCAARQNQQPAGIWCWGWNKYGAVGDGTTRDALSPERIVIHKG